MSSKEEKTDLLRWKHKLFYWYGWAALWENRWDDWCNNEQKPLQLHLLTGGNREISYWHCRTKIIYSSWNRYKNITVIRLSSFMSSEVTLRFIVLQCLVLVFWWVSLSHFHNVWSWSSVTLTQVICGKGIPAGNAAEASGVAADQDILCVCWWWGAPGAAKLGKHQVCVRVASVLVGLRCL